MQARWDIHISGCSGLRADGFRFRAFRGRGLGNLGWGRGPGPRTCRVQDRDLEP